MASHSAAVLLCRQPQDHVVGVSSARNGNKILVTVQGDGVITYDSSRLAAGYTKALGSSQAQLLAPVQQLEGSYVAAVQPHGSPHGLLVRTPVSTKQPRPLLDAEQQLPLPSALHSLHTLPASGSSSSSSQRSSSSSPCCVAVVLADGTVGAADFEEVIVRQCSSNTSASTGRQRSSQVPQLAASSNGSMLAVARQAAGASEVTVDIYMASSSGTSSQPAESAAPETAQGSGSLQLTHSCSLACPTPNSKLSDVSLSRGVVAVQWRDGCVTVYHSNLSQRASQAEHVATCPLPPALSEAVAAAAAAAAAAAPGQQSSRKRRAADDAAGATAKVLCAVVSDTHLLLLALQSPTQAWYAVLDSRYGCCLASGPLALEAAGATADDSRSSSSKAQLLPLPQQATATAALLAAGAVYLLHVPLPKADLAGLVSRLALGSSSSVALLQQPAAAAAAGRVVTSRQQINLAAIAAAVSSAQGAATAAQQGTAACILHEVPAAAAAAGAQQQSQGRASSEAASVVAAAAEQLSAVVAKQPVPAAELKQVVEQLCTALQPQQQQADPSRQQQHQTPAGRRGRQQQQQQGESQAGPQQLPMCATAMMVSQRLLAQGLAALADAQEWSALGQLHSLQPLQSLVACPGLLPALTAAQQYPLLRQVVLAAQDVPAESLVAAMQHLLLQQPGEAAARQEEATAMRAAAEAAVAAAAAAVAAGDAAAASALLPMARRAAAAVDGFSSSEVLLHVLLAAPVDSVEAQAALRSLPTPAVLKLLKQLDKWVQKYSALPLLREVPAAAAGTGTAGRAGGSSSWASVGLVGGQWDSSQAQALLVTPAWPQVLEWARMLLDAHLTRLAMLPAAAPLLQQLQGTLQQEVGATSRLVLLKGVVDHMSLGAPLPVVAEAANSEYTLELLDLRVAGR